MAARCLLYYITDRKAFPGDEAERRRRLLEKIASAARAGIDYIQLREKDLTARELESFAAEAVKTIREVQQLAPDPRPLTTALLINSRIDIVLAAGADGVHLRSDDISPQEARRIWESAAVPPTLRKPRRVGQPDLRPRDSAQVPIIGASCHTQEEVSQAAANGASFAVFAPIFEKKDAPEMRAAGLVQLEQACRVNISVLALGGVTISNARSCLEAGAAGIAAIRLFQENNIAAVVKELRG